MLRIFVTIAFMVYGCEGRWMYGFNTAWDVSVPQAKVIPVSQVFKEPRPWVPKLVKNLSLHFAIFNLFIILVIFLTFTSLFILGTLEA